MGANVRFEFDAERQVLIRCSSENSSQIIEKRNLIWRELGPQDESYARAIYLGQGCWESLVIAVCDILYSETIRRLHYGKIYSLREAFQEGKAKD